MILLLIISNKSNNLATKRTKVSSATKNVQDEQLNQNNGKKSHLCNNFAK